MFLKLLKSTFFLAILLLSYSCSTQDQEKKTKITKKPPLEIVYRQAYKNYLDQDYNEAIRLFELVEKNYSYSEWSPKALLMRAFIYYEAARYIDSLGLLQKFKKRHSGHKYLSYAEYLTAVCLFEQVNTSALSQENTSLALEQFKKIVEKYPNSDYAIDAKFKIDLLNEQFASKEMYLARYYMKREKWTPALYRLHIVLKNYQSTIYIEEALHRLVEINYKIGNVISAKKYASILGYNYNSSEWYKKSYKIIEDRNFLEENLKHNKSFIDKFKKLININ